MIHSMRLVVPAALVLTLLAACATSPPAPKISPLDVAGLSSLGTPLSEALVAAEQITDPRSRVFAYTRISQGYVDTGDPASALKLLDRTMLTVHADNIGAEIPDVLAEVADIYVKANAADRAVPILQEALVDAQRLTDPFNRGVVLERIVDSCIDAGAPAYATLRSALQAIYVIEDLWTRATVLTDTAARYQDRMPNPSVDVLLQQAIPAAGSIANPWLKSLALTDIALRFKAAGSSDSADYYATRAYDEINSVQVLRRTEDDAGRVVTTAENLAKLGMATQAVQVLSTIEFPYLRSEGLSAIALLVAGDGEQSHALQLCSEAIDVAQKEPLAYRRGLALGRAALVYGEINQDRLALATAAAAEETVHSITDVVEQSSVLEPAAEVQMRWGDPTTGISLLNRVGDIYARASALTDLAGKLMDAGLPPLAAKAASAAESLAPDAPYLRQNLYRSIAHVQIRLGDYGAAVALIAKITDPYTLAITLADLVTIPGKSVSLKEQDRVVLRNIGDVLIAADRPAATNADSTPPAGSPSPSAATGSGTSNGTGTGAKSGTEAGGQESGL